MRRYLLPLVAVLLLGLAGCFPTGGGLRAVIRTDPSPPRGSWPFTVEFDGSRSAGEIAHYLWAFKDPEGEEIHTAQGEIVEYTFDSPGEYRVYLTVVSPGGATHQSSIKVDVRSKYPIAEFEVMRTGHGATVILDASASYDPDGEIVFYHWNFGDGSTDVTGKDTPVVEHTYPGDGEYTVTLWVEDNYGDVSGLASQEVVVSGSCSSCG